MLKLLTRSNETRCNVTAGRLLKKLCLTITVFFCCSSIFGQGVITGKVTNEAGDSVLANINVQVKGKSTATQTSANGEFSISALPSDVLVFSSASYTTQEVAVGDRTTLVISLQGSVQSLERVIVIGYGSQRRKDLTGAVSSISSQLIEKVPVTTLDQAIQGRSSGVQVTSNDGAPGSGIQIQIRGIGSFGDNNPLFVVDGYPVTGGISNLNPSDIASMDILKDASATAIYGNRAANGVVIITTKRGRRDGVQVSFDALAQIQARPNTHKVLNAQDFAVLAAERSGPDAFGLPASWANPSSLRNIDWQDEVYQTGLRQNYNIAVRGGNEKVQSTFSLGYVDQKGIVSESFYKRLNATLGIDYTVNQWLKSSTNVKYSRADSKTAFGTGGQDAGFGVGTLTKLVPTLTGGNPLTDEIQDASGNYGFYPKDNQYLNYSDNIVAFIETQDQKNVTNYLLGNTSLEATLLPGLRIKTNLGLNTSEYAGYYFTPSHNRSQAPMLSFYSQSANNSFDWLWENTVAYTKNFRDHNIDFVGGVSAQETTVKSIGGQGNGSVSNELRDLAAVTNITNLYGNQVVTSLTSQFARLNYRYKDRYIVTATVRHDGSSRFADGNRYGTFPSVSVAWRLKDENFLKDNAVVSDLKIRGGIGEVGNQSIAPFQYLGQYGSGGPQTSYSNTGYPFNKVYQEGIVLNVLPNPDLKWEVSRQTNIGLDAAFLNNKLTFSADYYVKESRDFLLSVPIPAQTGFTSAARNVGSIRNQGIELSLEYRESSKDFSYGLGVNFTTVKNKLLSLAPGQDVIFNLVDLGFPNTGSGIWSTFSQSRVGGSVGEFYGFQSGGIFQTQAEIDALNAKAQAIYGSNTTYQGSTVQPGDRKFVDINGDDRLTDDDRIALGSPIPKFFTALNADASYKNFDFNMFWYASVGNKIFNYVQRTLETFGATQGGIGIQNVSQEYYDNRWTATNPSNRFARAVKNDPNGNTRPSSVYVEDGSYLRLKSLQIGYTIPGKVLNNAFSRLRVYVSGQNLITITGYSGLDPEIGNASSPSTGGRSVTASGIDIGTYPNSRFFTFGLNATF
ncbi:MAG: TonB-dependent receptor [Chitinophagaceae bacterium]|nr:MAG: TonB-dependent receptor [Chitinophagaceae bacterium]